MTNNKLSLKEMFVDAEKTDVYQSERTHIDFIEMMLEVMGEQNISNKEMRKLLGLKPKKWKQLLQDPRYLSQDVMSNMAFILGYKLTIELRRNIR